MGTLARCQNVHVPLLQFPGSNSVSLCCYLLLNNKWMFKTFFLVFLYQNPHLFSSCKTFSNNLDQWRYKYQSKTCAPLFLKFKISLNLCSSLCEAFWHHIYEGNMMLWIACHDWMYILYRIPETMNFYNTDEKSVFNDVMWRVTSQLISNPGL